MPYRIAIVILSGDNKALPKQTQGATISMTGRHRESNFEWTCRLSAESCEHVTSLGQYIFSLLPPLSSSSSSSLSSSSSSSFTSSVASSARPVIGDGAFHAAGVYEYEFRSPELALPPKHFKVQVMPAAPNRLLYFYEKQFEELWSLQAEERRLAFNKLQENAEIADAVAFNDATFSTAESATYLGSKARPIPASVGCALSPILICIEDGFQNRISWKVANQQQTKPSSFSMSSSSSSSELTSRTASRSLAFGPSMTPKRQQQGQQLLAMPNFPPLRSWPEPSSGIGEMCDGSNRVQKSGPPSPSVSGPKLEIKVAAIDTKSRINVHHEWLQEETDSFATQRNLQITMSGMINPKSPAEKEKNRTKSGVGPWEELVAVRVQAIFPGNAGSSEKAKEQLVLWFALSSGPIKLVKCLPNAKFPSPPKAMLNKSPLPPLRLVLLDAWHNRVAYPPLLECLELTARCGEAEATVRPIFCPQLTDSSAASSESQTNNWGDIGTLIIKSGWGQLHARPLESGGASVVSLQILGANEPTALQVPGSENIALPAPGACLWSCDISVTASSDAAAIDLGCDGPNSTLVWLSSFDIRSAASSHVALARDERLATIEGIAGAYVGELKLRILDEKSSPWQPSDPGWRVVCLAYEDLVSIDGDNTIDGNTGSSITSAAPEILFDMELRASVPCSALEITEWRVPKKAKMYRNTKSGKQR